MKICTVCSRSLSFDCFDTQSTGAQGRRADCKDCRKRFSRSQKGMVGLIYATQNSKSRKRGHPAPAYTQQELFDWMWTQPHALALYEEWQASGYAQDNKPSVDRLDDYKPYTLDNIRLIPWGDHKERYYQDAKDGINTKTCISVDQYTLSGDFIKTHHSYNSAARAVGGLMSNIRNVAEQITVTRSDRGDSSRTYSPKSAYGYVWKKPPE